MISKTVWMLGLVLSFATAASAGEAEDMALGKKLSPLKQCLLALYATPWQMQVLKGQ